MALVLLATYLVVMAVSTIFDGIFHKTWFSIFLLFAGIYLVFRAWCFHVDSNYLLGILLAGFAFISTTGFFYEWPFFVESYFLWCSITFLVVYLIFRQNIYLILFALTLGEVLLLVIYKLFLNIFIFAFLQAILIMAVFIVFISITKIKKEK